MNDLKVKEEDESEEEAWTLVEDKSQQATEGEGGCYTRKMSDSSESPPICRRDPRYPRAARRFLSAGSGEKVRTKVTTNFMRETRFFVHFLEVVCWGG